MTSKRYPSTWPSFIWSSLRKLTNKKSLVSQKKRRDIDHPYFDRNWTCVIHCHRQIHWQLHHVTSTFSPIVCKSDLLVSKFGWNRLCTMICSLIRYQKFACKKSHCLFSLTRRKWQEIINLFLLLSTLVTIQTPAPKYQN